MEKGKVLLDIGFDISEDYDMSIPGLSNNISLVVECWCVDTEYDHEEGATHITAKENCNHCHGTGLCPTDNGKAILDFIKKYGN